MADKLVFGAAGNGASALKREPMEKFVAALAAEAGIEIGVFEAATYEELANATHRGEVHLAWLPPIPFIALERRDAVIGLVTHARDGHSEFHSVLIVRATSPARVPADLQGARAAWVDPYSASGYVVPRVELDRLGVDPRTAFPSEKFHRSHEAVVRAVVERTADFGATYAGLDAAGAIVRGAWLDGVITSPEHIRVLATFSEISGDVIAARSDVPERTRARLAKALAATARDRKQRLICRDFFGCEDFLPFVPWGYERLREMTTHASERGLLEAREAD